MVRPSVVGAARNGLLLIVTVALVVTPVAGAVGSAIAVAEAPDEAPSQSGHSTLTAGSTVGPAVAAAPTNGTRGDGTSASCSYRQTDSRIARDGSTAGVLDPRGENDLLVLLGGFTDTSPTYTPSQIEEQYFGETSNAQGAGTLQDYYLEISGGMINLSSGPAGVSGWYETDMESDQIYDEDGDVVDLTPQDNSQFVRKVIEQADSDIDFSNYDNDGDGCIAIMVVYQGVDLRAHAAAPWGNFFRDADFTVDVDGVSVSAYARVQEVHTDNNGDRTGNIETIGTPAHELGHLFGLPDLYEENGGDDIGIWGLMATGNAGFRWNSEPVGSTPVHPSAWTKLQLLRHPAPGPSKRLELRTTIPPADRPGILPPATENEYYRIDPRSVEGCSACEDQYYLIGYRQLTGFDAGLRPYAKLNNSLRISRINGPWDGNMSNDPDLIEGENRLNDFGNHSFNASNTNLATLADGSDSGVDLRNFSEQYGMATFNDPPQRHLDHDETGVYAIAVSQTLPDGTETGDDWRVDHRVAIEGNSNMTVELSTGTPSQYQVRGEYASASGENFLQVKISQRGLADGVVTEGAKVIHRADASTDYISASTYPTFPLPSAMSMEVAEPWSDFGGDESTVTAEVDLSAAGEPYEYGQWGSPEKSQFGVEIGGAEVATSDLTVTELAPHRYEVEAAVPVERMEGYDLNVSFTGQKAGVEHTVTDRSNILEPTMRAMSGDGSAGNPYEITSLQELQAVDAASDAHFELQTDLDAAQADDWFGGKGFIPIGNTSAFPEGVNVTFDGNGHTISDLTIQRPNTQSVGLFGALGPDAEVSDLTLENPTLTGGPSDGGAVGTLAAHSRGTITNVTVKNARLGEESEYIGRVGGLVGYLGRPHRGSAPSVGTIKDSSVSGHIDGNGPAGGIAAHNGGGEIIGSHSTATIDAGRQSGGLVGYNEGDVRRSYATGDVSGGHDTGGLLGRSEGETFRSYATGNVSGDARTGGLVGRLWTNNGENIATVTESFATGDVEGTRKVGGLVGESNYGNVTKSYARGNVSGELRVGGLVGMNEAGYDAGFVKESYATGRVTGDRFVEGLAYGVGPVTGSYWASDNIDGEPEDLPTGQPVPPEKMKGETARENMTAFDFENTWTTVEGDYPQLQWYVEASTDDEGDDESDSGDDSSEDSTAADDSGGSSAGSSGPGMGVPAGIAGLVLAGYLLARRTRSNGGSAD